MTIDIWNLGTWIVFHIMYVNDGLLQWICPGFGAPLQHQKIYYIRVLCYIRCRVPKYSVMWSRKNWEKLNWIQCTPLCNQNGFDATTSIICDAANSRVVELSRWYCLPEMTLAKNLHVLKWATRYTTPAWASWRPVHGFVRSNE